MSCSETRLRIQCEGVGNILMIPFKLKTRVESKKEVAVSTSSCVLCFFPSVASWRKIKQNFSLALVNFQVQKRVASWLYNTWQGGEAEAPAIILGELLISQQTRASIAQYSSFSHIFGVYRVRILSKLLIGAYNSLFPTI